MGDVSKAVLITGCSSGIGEATARRLAERGWTVYASARRIESIEHLREAGCKLLALDVTDEQSMSAAVSAVEQAEGAVGVLVNNAGYSQGGAVESVSMEAIRRQFETNVFGLTRMCQLVLPGMRAQRYGKIVNVSSMGANFTFPGGGFYHSSKFAVEAISDALRFEVRGYGVDVIVMQPGLILTNFGEAAGHSIDSGANAAGGPYAEFNTAVAKATREVYEDGPIGKLGGPPLAVAKKIERALRARRPKTRYLVTPSAHLLVNQRKLMTDRMWDRMMRTQFPQPK
jgi:NADP-dependent 3-hydroxy acid dehydrogenase YdfG